MNPLALDLQQKWDAFPEELDSPSRFIELAVGEMKRTGLYLPRAWARIVISLTEINKWDEALELVKKRPTRRERNFLLVELIALSVKVNDFTRANEFFASMEFLNESALRLGLEGDQNRDKALEFISWGHLKHKRYGEAFSTACKIYNHFLHDPIFFFLYQKSISGEYQGKEDLIAKKYRICVINSLKSTALAVMGQFTKAIQICENEVIEREWLWTARIRIVSQFAAQGRLQEALSYLKEKFDFKHMNSSTAYDAIIEHLVKRQEIAQAFDVVREMDKNKVCSDKARYLIAVEEAKQNRFQNAIRIARRICNEYDDHFWCDRAIFLISIEYLKKGQVDQAVALCEEVSEEKYKEYFRIRIAAAYAGIGDNQQCFDQIALLSSTQDRVHALCEAAGSSCDG